MQNFKNHKAAIGEALYFLAEKYDKFRLIVADVAARVNANEIITRWPEKVINVGIAEQNMIGIASAFADEGYIVYCVSYAPFITLRVLDQLKVFQGIMKCNIKFIGFSAGLGGSDLGPTHTSFEDIGAIKSIPNIDIVCPSNYEQIMSTIVNLSNSANPTYIRITEGIYELEYDNSYDYNKPHFLLGSEKSDYIVIGNGSLVANCYNAVKNLILEKYNFALIDYPFVRPYNLNFISKLKYCKKIFTVEEHNIFGGFGSSIIESLNICHINKNVVCIGINDKYYYPDRRSFLLSELKLDCKSLYKTMKEEINNG